MVCAGIHMTNIPEFAYRLLWDERSVRSVANLTRGDARELLGLAAVVGLRPIVTTYSLVDANDALANLRAGRFEGSAVLTM